LRSPAFGSKLKKTTSGGEPKAHARVFPLGGEAHAAHIPLLALPVIVTRCSRFPRAPKACANALATQAFAVPLCERGVCIVTRWASADHLRIICSSSRC